MSVSRLAKALFAGLLLLMPGAAFADKHEFSIVVLPDTQLYAETYPALIEAQMQWIIDNRDDENIIYVAHLGDLKDDTHCNDKEIAAATGGSRSEWDIANQAFNLLETATSTAQPHGIPFGTIAGNHDFEPYDTDSDGDTECPNDWGNATQRVLTTYNDLFGPNRFAGRAYYGGSRIEDNPATPAVDEGSNEDNYTLFESNGVKFIAINLGYRQLETLASPPPEQQWANQKLQEHSDRIAIVTSHFVIRCNNSAVAPTVNISGIIWNGCNSSTAQQNTFGPWGAQVYQSLKNKRNLFMMLGAHNRGEAYRIETRSGMQPVHAMLSNYQNITYPALPTNPATFSNLPPTAIGNGYGNSGFMRIMRFDIDSGTVDIETFAPPVPETPAVAGTISVADCQDFFYDYQPEDICSTPAISARGYLPSTYTPANPTAADALHTGTASNITGIDFTGYADDTTPDPFSFTDQTGVAPNTAITSNTITLSGINVAADISVSGGQYSIDGAAFTSAAGTVNNGQGLRVRVTSSSGNSTTTSATLTIGGVSDSFDVTTTVGPGASVVYDATTGYATGIRDLEINGTSYNVQFVDASYNAAYASSPPLFLDDAVGASAAADAIQAVLNAEATVPEINASPNEIVWVPLQEVSATQFRAAQTGHDTSSAPWQRFGDFLGDRSVDWTPWFFTRFTDISAPP